jgi:LuxR family maltose regulon positive regulatory protein
MAYVWEGQVLLAETVLQPPLAAAEVELGRRSPLTCMLATVLAASVWERDRAFDALDLMADRLDVLEHAGLPETLLLGYRTLARIAISQDAEHRAAELLEEMHAVGVARGLPRVCIASLAEQVRMHARRFRAETCRELCRRIDEALAEESRPQGRLWQCSVVVLRDLAQGMAAISARDWHLAVEPLGRAEESARSMRQGRLTVEIKGLRALALDRSGVASRSLLLEAADLAQACGLLRVFTDAHPDLADWHRHVIGGVATVKAPAISASVVAPHGSPAPPPTRATRTMPSMALTPKEREVLGLLARNLTNKEIGLAMHVGEETIKWHVRNLFLKVDAGSRKQVVQRARILGLIESSV